jgi:hypothetical protein
MKASYVSFNCLVCSVEQHQYLPFPFVSVCQSCRSLIEYTAHQQGIDLNKKVDDCAIFSIPSIGGIGSFKNIEFVITGLIRSIASHEIIESWLCLFEDSSQKWLRRIDNVWYFFENESIVLSSTLIKSKKPGNVIWLNELKYNLCTISKELSCSIFGQIPSKNYFEELGFKVLIKSDDGNEVIEINLQSHNKVFGYKGLSVEIEALGLSRFKEFNIWY